MKLYVTQNWAFRPEEFEQCKSEKNFTRDYSAFKEGCQIYGYLEVNRVSGSFHIAPGKSYAINHVHGEFLIVLTVGCKLLCLLLTIEIPQYMMFNLIHLKILMSHITLIHYLLEPL